MVEGREFHNKHNRYKNKEDLWETESVHDINCESAVAMGRGVE